MKKTIVIATLALCALAGAGIASASAKPFPDLPDTPAFTSRYPAAEGALTDRQRIDQLEEKVKALDGRVGALFALRTWDAAQDKLGRDVAVAQRRDMLDELYRLQQAVHMQEGCR